MSHSKVRLGVWAVIWLVQWAVAHAAPIESPIQPTRSDTETPPVTIPEVDAPEVVSDGTFWTLDARLQSSEGKQARQAFEAGQIRKCLLHLEALVDEQPGLPPPQVLLAQVYLSLGNTIAAMQSLEEAAWRHKNEPEVFVMCGHIELQHGRLANACVHFEKALSLEPPPNWSAGQTARLQVSCYGGLATIAERRGDWAAADEALSHTADRQPGNAALLQRWGKALFMLGSIDDAEDKFYAAYRENPTGKPPELSMASLLAKDGRFEQAEEWYKKAIENHPLDGIAHFEYAAGLLRAGRTDEALQMADAAEKAGLPVERLRTELKMIRGIIASGTGEFETAEKLFTEVLRESPGHAQALRRLPLALVEQEDDAKRRRAVQIAKVQAKKNPQSAEALATLAWVHYRLGEMDEVRAAIQPSVSPADPESTYLLARVIVESGDPERASPLIRALAAALENPGWFPHRSEAQEWVEGIVLTLD